MNKKRMIIIVAFAALIALAIAFGAFQLHRTLVRQTDDVRQNSANISANQSSDTAMRPLSGLPTLVRRDAPVGSVYAISGPVTATEPGRPPRMLGMHSMVYAGDRIVTGAKALLRVRLTDATLLTLGEHSRLVIDAYNFSPSSATPPLCRLTEVDGLIRIKTGKITAQAPDKFRVSTDRTIINIRGCEVGIDTRGPTHKVFAIALGENENLALLPGDSTSIAAGARPLLIKQAGMLAEIDKNGSMLQRRFTNEELATLPTFADAASSTTPLAEQPATAHYRTPTVDDNDIRRIVFPRDLKPDIFPFQKLVAQVPDAVFTIVNIGDRRYRKAPVYIDLTGTVILPSSSGSESGSGSAGRFNVLNTTAIPTFITPTTGGGGGGGEEPVIPTTTTTTIPNPSTTTGYHF